MRIFQSTAPAFFFWITAILSAISSGDERPWDLQRCIEHALSKSIRIRTAHLDSHSALSSLKQSSAERLPSLSAGAQYQASQQNSFNSGWTAFDPGQTLRYSLNAGWTIFAGTGIRTGIRKSEQELKRSGLRIERIETEVTIAVVQAYLQVLFAREIQSNARQSLEASERQYERAVHMHEAGSASAVDVAGMQSQYAADKYDLTIARNNLETRILELRQLLEISAHERFSPFFPPSEDSLIAQLLPPKDVFIAASFAAMPDEAIAKLGVEIAKLHLRKSQTVFAPTLTLSAGISANQDISGSTGPGGEANDNYNPGIGAQLGVPIYDKRKTRTAVEQARIGVEYAQLELEAARKELTQKLETVYLNASSAQSRHEAAVERLAAARKTMELAEERYNLGMMETVDLLVQKNAFLAAQNEFMQARYSALLHAAMVDFYQGKEIDIF